MPTVKEWYCPSESSNKILKELGNHTSQGGQGDNTQTSQAIIQTIQRTTKLQSGKVVVAPSTQKEITNIQGSNTLVSFTLAMKNPLISLQSAEMTIKIDDTTYSDTLLNILLMMQMGKGFHINYYEEITNVDLTITSTLNDSGSIFYMYITEPMVIAKNFVITLNNTYAYNSTIDKTILAKMLYMIRSEGG